MLQMVTVEEKITDIPETGITSLPVKPDTHIKDIPIEAILDYRAKGLSHRDIARLLGCTRVNITNRLRSLVEYVDTIDTFKRHKGDILAVKQSILLDKITPEAVKECSVRDAVVSFGILYDKQALHEGRATSIVNYADISNDISKLEAEIQAIEMKERDGVYQSVSEATDPVAVPTPPGGLSDDV